MSVISSEMYLKHLKLPHKESFILAKSLRGLVGFVDGCRGVFYCMIL